MHIFIVTKQRNTFFFQVPERRGFMKKLYLNSSHVMSRVAFFGFFFTFFWCKVVSSFPISKGIHQTQYCELHPKTTVSSFNQLFVIFFNLIIVKFDQIEQLLVPVYSRIPDWEGAVTEQTDSIIKPMHTSWGESENMGVYTYFQKLQLSTLKEWNTKIFKLQQVSQKYWRCTISCVNMKCYAKC